MNRGGMVRGEGEQPRPEYSFAAVLWRSTYIGGPPTDLSDEFNAESKWSGAEEVKKGKTPES
eukprot:2127322-Amphidinium_carterae.1